MANLNIGVLEFDNVWEALEHLAVDPDGRAIRWDGRAYVVSRDDADRLDAAGVEFAYLGEIVRADGTCCIVTVPVN